MENSVPLHVCHVNKMSIIINRSHAILHSIAILFLIHYRLSFFFQHPQNITIPTLPWLLIFVSELLLYLAWLLSQSHRWRPVYRTVFPERLPADDKLPAIDVYICTADPKKEPSVEVMNTVISAMALDYPPEKLHVYVSDDAGSDATLRCTKEAWNFARYWVPFCRKYGLVTACPDVYFSSSEDGFKGSSDFKAERKKIEVISEHHKEKDEVKIPMLVYVSRKKRLSRHHNFNAGALNVLLRVSAMISNSPHILVLDCDMHCNDPTSARQAMCYYCDPQTSQSIAFVQFPQTFRNISEDDIYDSQLRFIFKIHWLGFDGAGGPAISGTNFYIKRKALLGSFTKQQDLMTLKRSFGPSNDFIKTLVEDYKPCFIKDGESSKMLLENANVLASCSYEDQTTWGTKANYFTGFTLHRKGWKSVYLYPKRPQFLGTATTNFNEASIQWTRLVLPSHLWASKDVFGSSYVLFRSCMYASSLLPLCLGFALIPQLCLFNGIPLYPKISDSNFIIFSIIFISAISKILYEVVSFGDQFKVWKNEWRIWMVKSVTCYTYGSLDAILNKLGIKEASFLPTNKVTDDEQVKLYEMGIFDFRAATMFLAPLVTVILVNFVAFAGAVVKALVMDDNGDRYWEKMFGQMFLSFYILVSNYAIIEGMIIRKDKSSIPLSATLWSVVFSVFILLIGSVILC
ncbi:hypothetical protein GOBAR_AA28154 [Gossypium barbadense]|uniref:Glycosyltransferase 2-like domain-containing protein n=1 Tax=Gossypium barbadense TaxID=3634 RepID=A0A2P5WN60_GOSBA|nr:hypothetical protein GOBAR_AA28154 [Gossypium barbadense]